MNNIKRKTCKIVIGNGFDLFCKLNTKYSDFFMNQEKIIYSNYLPNKSIKRNNATLENEKMNLYISGYYSHFPLTYNKAIYNNVIFDQYSKETTFWDLLFYYNENRDKLEKWCDVEEAMYNFLYDNKSGKTLFETVYSFLREKGRKNLDITYEWLEIPVSYCVYKNFNTYSKRLFAQDLLAELNKFEERFGKYINEEFSNKLLVGNNDNLIKFFADIEERFEIESIDTFNYSRLEDKKDLSIKYNIPNVYHINGRDDHPIFGVDYNEYKKSDSLYIFTKTYRRMNSDFYDYETSLSPIDGEFDNLVIFGHSLNRQDYNYYFPIFDYLDLYNYNSKKSIIFYYNIYDEKERNKIKTDNISNFMEMMNEYAKYKGYSQFSSRLVDSLAAQGRIKFREIKSIMS